MGESSFLLPGKLRSLGFIFIGIGVTLGILRFYFGLKPDFLHQKAFAFLSLYVEPLYFKIIKNQLLEEIAGLFLLFGLFLTAFTREKKENHQNNYLRLKSFFISTYLAFLFLVASILFTFGIGFIYMMIINLFLYLLIYNISFRILLARAGNKNDEDLN